MSAPTMPTPAIPLLRDGERLSREEFERRYEAMPDVKAELLDGVVYIMASPVSNLHGGPHGTLMGWLVYYHASTPGVSYGDNETMRLAGGSIPQPDVHLRILESHGGNSHVGDDNFIAGAPELVGEVSRSSDRYDRSVKLPIYRRDGVREVILWDVEDEKIDWFVLRGGEYEPLSADADGIIKSETFPGLWLDVGAVIRRDTAAMFRALQRGIESPEHAQFVERLQQLAAERGGRT